MSTQSPQPLPSAEVAVQKGGAKAFEPSQIDRPDPVLLKYYAIVSLTSGPLFPVVFLPLFCKYATLRYRFDQDGVAMQWGVLFRREIYLTYRRIQDIHLTRNIVQRWMGIASLAVQTASGSSSPEMTIEGLLVVEQLRDYLYLKMQGAKGYSTKSHSTDGQRDGTYVGKEGQTVESDEILQLLCQIRDGLSHNKDSNEVAS